MELSKNMILSDINIYSHLALSPIIINILFSARYVITGTGALDSSVSRQNVPISGTHVCIVHSFLFIAEHWHNLKIWTCISPMDISDLCWAAFIEICYHCHIVSPSILYDLRIAWIVVCVWGSVPTSHLGPMVSWIIPISSKQNRTYRLSRP